MRPELSSRLVCSWNHRVGSEPLSSAILPDGCIDIIWDGGRLFVAGPDTAPVAVDRNPGTWYAGVRFKPGLAPTVLGVPSSTLVDQRIDLGDILPALSSHLVDLLAAAETDRDAAGIIERGVQQMLPSSADPDQLVIGLVGALVRGPRASPVASLADELGVSERQLHRRCTAAVGYGPKMLDRVLRFRRFLTLLSDRSNVDLAMLAARAGYADQAHLTRECRRLGGTTPGAMAAAA